MKIRYLGPRAEIRTSTGIHRKGEVKEYPTAVGRELIETGIRNKFEEVTDAKEEKAYTATISSQEDTLEVEPKSKGKSK